MAIVLLLLLLMIVPTRAAEIDLNDAARSYSEGKFDSAMASLDRFEKSSSPSAESLDLRGCILVEQQKYEEAKKAFEDAHEANPKIFAPRLHVGDLLLRQKKFGEARAVYEELLKETNILMSNERLRFAILLSYLGEHQESLAKQALDAITFPTETPSYYYAQAAWAFAHNNKSEAQDWIKKAQQVFDAEATSWFGQHLYNFGWLKKRPPLPIHHS